MNQKKDNSKVTIQPDGEKSYVYIKDGKKDVGFLSWHYDKKKWMFNRL